MSADLVARALADIERRGAACRELDADRALVADEVERLRAEVATAKAVAEQSAIDHRCAVDMARHERETSDQLRASIASREEVIGELRAVVTRAADTLGAIRRRVCAESCERDVILDAIGDAYDAARRCGEVSMRHAAASWCERAGHAELAADIRELALTGSQPTRRLAKVATPSAPLNVADAAARARSAAAQRAR